MKNEQFMRELAALLSKHDAYISWGCTPTSDLHGVYGEYMQVTDGKDKKILRIEGCVISNYEIQELIGE